MNNWEQGFIESNGAQLNYFRSGGNLPPIVLVHGFTDSAVYFTRLAESLATDWDVVAYDARGHGKSSRYVDSGSRFDDQVRVSDLVNVIEYLSLDRPVLIGHSMGAATIALTLAEHPQISRGAVLEDPAWWELDDDQLELRRAGRAQQAAAWREWVLAFQAMSIEDGIAMRTTDEPTWNSTDVETSSYARIHFDLDLFEPFLPERSPWRASVRAFQQPVLLMLGSMPERSAIITPQLAIEARELNPMLTWNQIDAAGHHLRYDQFDAFIGAVNTFFADTGMRTRA